MVNDMESRQSEGYDFYDSRQLVFLAAGFPELVYVVGTDQNAAIQGGWPNVAGWFGPLLTVNALAAQANVVVADITVFELGQIVIVIDPVTNLSETAIVAVITPTAPAPTGVLTMLVNLVNPYLIANAATVHPYLPVNAQNTLIISTQPCLIRLINTNLLSQQAIGVIPAGLPVQIPIAAGVWYTLPDKWVIIYAVGQGVAPGVLTIKASG